MDWKNNKNLKLTFFVLLIISFIALGIALWYVNFDFYRTSLSAIAIPANKITKLAVITLFFLIGAMILSFIFKSGRKTSFSPLKIVRLSLIFLVTAYLPAIQFIVYYPIRLFHFWSFGYEATRRGWYETPLDKLFVNGDIHQYPRVPSGLIVLIAISVIYSIIILWIYQKIKQRKA